MKKVERVELVLENCEVFEIRAEDIVKFDLKLALPKFSETLDEVTISARDVFFEVTRIYGTFVFSEDFVSGKEYVVPSERLQYMDIVYLVIHYADGGEETVYVPFNELEVPDDSWQVTNVLEHVLEKGDSIYVRIGEGTVEDRLNEIESEKNDFDTVIDEGDFDINDINSFLRRGIRLLNVIKKDEIKVGGRVAYRNRQGDVVAEYVTDISGDFVGLRSGNVIHYTKVTALVAG